MSDQARRVAYRRAAEVRANRLKIDEGARAKRLKRVLVVDDDPVARQVVTTILGGQGYEVLARSEALGTVAVITRERPDIVVLDVNMPGLSGDSLARLVNLKSGHSTRVILHSSQPLGELTKLAREVGALGCIEKGDPRDFLDEFEALLK